MAKMGRPKKRKSEKQDWKVLVSLTRSDYSRLKHEAEQQGSTMAGVLVRKWKGE